MTAASGARLCFGCGGNQGLTQNLPSSILRHLMTHTSVSWLMCMRGRPRRSETGAETPAR
jgi:hypothetical protein